MIDIVEFCPTLILNSAVAAVLTITTISFIFNKKDLVSLVIPALLALIFFSVSWLFNLIYILFIEEILLLHISSILILSGVVSIFYIIINFALTFRLIIRYRRTTPPKSPDDPP